MAWTALTFNFASNLTSTQMTQLQANFIALAEGSSGSPNVDYTYGSQSVVQFTDWVPPAGIYYFYQNDYSIGQHLGLYIFDGSVFNFAHIFGDNSETVQFGSLIFCDGTNIKISNSDPTARIIKYAKFGS